MEEKWICNKCGAETTDKPESRNTTCKACGKGRYQNWKKCVCGKWFHASKSIQVTCSKECGYKIRETGGKKGKHYPQAQRARIAICPVCGKEFRAVKDFKDRNAVYCSKECWSKRATIFTKCEYCGKEFKTCESSGQKFCSKKCRDKAFRGRVGELSPAWQGGKTKESQRRRTRVEYKEWRLAVFERDKFTCQKCGKKTRGIEAHHIKEACNYPELIYDISNGVTLCHECHKETDNYGYKAKKTAGSSSPAKRP